MKMNIGCGQNHVTGYINVDISSSCNPDAIINVERTPWIINNKLVPESSVSELVFWHSFEHLGKETDIFFNIVKECYRVLQHGGELIIATPHWRSDNWISDPTHCRVLNPQIMSLFSKKQNEMWIEKNASNSTLALQLNVDFEIMGVSFNLSEKYKQMYEAKQITDQELHEHSLLYNNVIEEIQMKLVAIKEIPPEPGAYKSIFD